MNMIAADKIDMHRAVREPISKENSSMTFVNEYASVEDIQKYNLDEVWLNRNPVYRREGKLPSGFRHQWTIDRERNFYFMVTGGGGYDRGSITEGVLYLDGVLLNVELEKPGEGSKSFSEQPYRIVWNLVKWTSPAFLDTYQLPFRSCSNASGLSWSR